MMSLAFHLQGESAYYADLGLGLQKENVPKNKNLYFAQKSQFPEKGKKKA